MRLLIDHGANVNVLNNQNNTPLHEACCSGSYECVKYLLESCHANPTIRNKFGMRAKELVKENARFIALFDRIAHQPDVVEQTHGPVDLNESHMGVDSLNISCTYRGRKSGRVSKGAREKRVLLFGTGMSDIDKVHLHELATQMNIQIAKEMNNNGFL